MTPRRIVFSEYTRAAFVAEWLLKDGRYAVRVEGDSVIYTDAPRNVVQSIPQGNIYGVR